MEEVLAFPFLFLRAPAFRLRMPSIPVPGPFTVFCFVLLSYYLVFSGIIYDVIVEPPSIGSHQDPNGAVKPLVFLQYRINGQFIIEGLAAGFLFCLGGLGFMILDKANRKDVTNRYMLLVSGAVCVVVSYNLCIVFLRMKLPGYQLG